MTFIYWTKDEKHTNAVQKRVFNFNELLKKIMNASIACAIVVCIVIIIAILTNSSYNKGKHETKQTHTT